MPYELTNHLRAKSIVRIVGNTATSIKLTDMQATAAERVSAASISIATGVTDGVWRIYRGDNTSGTLVLELPSFSHFVFGELDLAVANTPTANVYVTNSGSAGTLVLQFTKTATYSPALDGM
jgi:hypothetical protein